MAAKKRPKAAIIVIGTELTLGQSSESNSVFLGQWLSSRGYNVRSVLKVPDDIEIIAGEIEHQAAASIDVLILTGGLGSTHDDVTRESLAKVVGKPLITNQAMKDLIEARMPTGVDRLSFLKQAYLPEGGSPIPARQGTAPGIVVNFNGKIIYALPGVPAEMKEMLDFVAKDLLRRHGRLPAPIIKRLRLTGASEPVIANILQPLIVTHRDLVFNILAKPEDITLTIIGNEGLPSGAGTIETVFAELLAKLEDYVYSANDASLAQVVGELLLDRKLTLGVAESITAGQIGAEIAAVAGSSRYFRGGITAYHDSAKERLLDVSHETLQSRGAVSSETAVAMAEGARLKLGADIGLSVTGIAGPTGVAAEKPIGLVFVGIADSEGVYARQFNFQGERRVVQRKTTFAALNLLRLNIMKRNSSRGPAKN